MEENDKNSFLSKLPTNENSSFIILYTCWTDEGIEFKLVDCSKEKDTDWTGHLPIQDLRNSAKELDIPDEEFIQESRQALCTSGGVENFTYSIESSKFIWRKLGKFRVVYGEVSLDPAKDLKTQMILNSIEVIKDLSDNYQRLQMQYQTQSVEFQSSLESYRKYVDRTKSLETTLLTKFCVILNAKKDKIAELQEFIKEKNLKFPKRVEPEENTNPDGSTDDELTPKEKSSLKTLPKRKAIIERRDSRQSIPIDKNTPGCSYAAEKDPTEEMDIFDEI